ncbi:MAG: hypothetical protein Alpg2KO_27810 [Alphaproteobacteria bacterium]
MLTSYLFLVLIAFPPVIPVMLINMYSALRLRKSKLRTGHGGREDTEALSFTIKEWLVVTLIIHWAVLATLITPIIGIGYNGVGDDYIPFAMLFALGCVVVASLLLWHLHHVWRQILDYCNVEYAFDKRRWMFGGCFVVGILIEPIWLTAVMLTRSHGMFDAITVWITALHAGVVIVLIGVALLLKVPQDRQMRD